MTDDEFNAQMSRLGAMFGNKAYTGERLKFILLEVRKQRADVFERAVTRLIKTKRVTPLVLDIVEAVQAIHGEDKQRALESAPAFRGYGEILGNAAAKTRADGDFVKACIKLLSDYTSAKIDRAQFEDGCDSLDELANVINPRSQRRDLVRHGSGWKFK
jgi:hypothetical protein